MNQNLVVLGFNLAEPDEGSAGSVGEAYTVLPIGATLVYAVASPKDDDSGATIDILDDGTDAVTGIDASDHDVPGTWISTHFGGTNAPVYFAKDSEVSIDINAAAVGNRFDVYLWFLTGVD